MAKTTSCAFCGVELKKGLFGGETEKIQFTNKSITCCKECAKKYEFDVAIECTRFGTKLDNVIKTAKIRPTENEIAQMFVKYLDEKEYYKNKNGEQNLNDKLSFFSYSPEGYFSVLEFGKGFMNRDISIEDMVASAEMSKMLTGFNAFDKNDITKIEYAKEGIGNFNGLFQKVYSFAIRLNDESVITYKPCITRVTTYGGGFGIGYYHSAKKRLIETLEDFKQIIGSDLPIVKVRKI